MPQFYYKALNKEEEVIKGHETAPSEDEMIAQLIEKGFMPISVSEKSAGSSVWEFLNQDLGKNSNIQKNELLSFTKEFSTLLNAGIDIENSFSMMIDFSKGKRRKKVLSELLKAMQNGSSLSDAMKTSSLNFPKDYVAIIKAGENSGQLKSLLSHQEKTLENQININNEIKSSLIYPAFLLLVSILAIGVLIGVVLPGFREIFTSSNIELPYTTAVLLNLGEWLKANVFYLAALIVLLALALVLALKNEATRLWVDKALLRTPLFGSIIQFEATTTFSTIMGTLLSGGITLPDAIEITKDTINSRHIKKSLEQANLEVRAGQQLSNCLAEKNIFPDYAIRLVSAAEKTGQVSIILHEIGKIYSIKLKQKLKNFVALIVPVMIAIFGAIIGLLIYGLLTAILSLNELAF